MSTPTRFSLKRTLSGTLPIDNNRVLIADLEAFLTAAKRKGATEVTFNVAEHLSPKVVVGVGFSVEAAEA